jgi:hypothetical protein
MPDPNYKALCAELLAAMQTDNWEECEEVWARAEAALAQPESAAPTDEEWDAMKERLWDQYQTIGYQGERFMYDNDFSTAFDDARAVLARWGTPANNTSEENLDG